MFNFLKKSKNNNQNDNQQKMGMLQRIAMKKIQNMSPGEREKMMQEAFKPENRDKLMKAMEQMQASGQVSKSQIEEAKKRLGL